jgi:hypothetical protein
VTKIEAETTTEMTETTTDLRDVATSARKRIAGYRSIQTRNGRERKKLIRASLTTTLKNALSSISPTAKETRT